MRSDEKTEKGRQRGTAGIRQPVTLPSNNPLSSTPLNASCRDSAENYPDYSQEEEEGDIIYEETLPSPTFPSSPRTTISTRPTVASRTHDEGHQLLNLRPAGSTATPVDSSAYTRLSSTLRPTTEEAKEETEEEEEASDEEDYQPPDFFPHEEVTTARNTTKRVSFVSSTTTKKTTTTTSTRRTTTSSSRTSAATVMPATGRAVSRSPSTRSPPREFFTQKVPHGLLDLQKTTWKPSLLLVWLLLLCVRV